MSSFHICLTSPEMELAFTSVQVFLVVEKSARLCLCVTVLFRCMSNSNACQSSCDIKCQPYYTTDTFTDSPSTCSLSLPLASQILLNHRWPLPSSHSAIFPVSLCMNLRIQSYPSPIWCKMSLTPIIPTGSVLKQLQQTFYRSQSMLHFDHKSAVTVRKLHKWTRKVTAQTRDRIWCIHTARKRDRGRYRDKLKWVTWNCTKVFTLHGDTITDAMCLARLHCTE